MSQLAKYDNLSSLCVCRHPRPRSGEESSGFDAAAFVGGEKGFNGRNKLLKVLRSWVR